MVDQTQVGNLESLIFGSMEIVTFSSVGRLRCVSVLNADMCKIATIIPIYRFSFLYYGVFMPQTLL